jgi:hypothetical protein
LRKRKTFATYKCRGIQKKNSTFYAASVVIVDRVMPTKALRRFAGDDLDAKDYQTNA